MINEHPSCLSRRVKAFEPASVDYAREVVRAHVLDISLTGALLHMESPCPTGTVLTLKCKLLTVGARVAWTKGARLGIAFLRPIAMDDLRAVVSDDL